MLGNLVYLYLLSPLHTGGTTQEGNLLGIARESHTNFPYLPSSSVRGRLRAATSEENRKGLWGNTIDDVTNKSDENLKQGSIWIGDGSILWLPVPSLSHGVIWVSCPLLLQRWARFTNRGAMSPQNYSTSLGNSNRIYLKDAILKSSDLKPWDNWQTFVPEEAQAQGIKSVIVMPDQYCATLIQMSLWRQVKIKLDEHKAVDGGFRYEEAIPPDTLMYFPWGVTAQANGSPAQDFTNILDQNRILQLGGQESLGRGFIQQWSASAE